MDSPRRYVYFRVANGDDLRLDPAALTDATGIDATVAWRVGDVNPHRPELKRRWDLWRVDSPVGKDAPLDAQLVALFDKLKDAWKPLVAATRGHVSVVQYVIHVEDEPVEFHIDAENVQIIGELGGVVDCDLYCVPSANVQDGRCEGCKIELPTTIDRIKDHIGGELRAADIQIKFLAYGVGESDATERLALDEDNSRRFDGDIEAHYLRELGCLQFTSDVLPTSAYVPEIEPEVWMSKFTGAIEELLIDLPTGKRELRVSVTDRGDYQSATGLHFDSEILEKLRSVDAGVSVRFRHVVVPSFDAAGNCKHCDRNVTGLTGMVS